MTPRAAFFLPSLAGGGSERTALGLASGLARRGLPVDLALASSEGSWRPCLARLPEGLRTVDLKARTGASLPRLLRYLRRRRPRVLVSSLPHANSAALLARALGAGGTAVAVRQASDFASEYAAADFRYRTAMRLERSLLRFADAVVANSRAMAENLSRDLPRVAGRVRFIRDPAVGPDVAQLAAAPADHPWFDGDGPPVVLSVGRLAREKGHRTLVRAFAKLRESRPARLAVLGEGPERPALEALAQELGIAGDVILPGFRINPFAWMARARVFALSSTFEGCPNALVQAMACGAPVVSTDCPTGPDEILEGGKWGRLVPVGDPAALAAAIRDTLDAPAPPELLKARAGAWSAEAAVDRYAELLAELAEERR